MAKRKTATKKKTAKRVMTKEQYREAIDALDLNQVQAGRFIGVGPRTSRRWALGEAPIPRATAMLLRLMVRKKHSPEDVARMDYERHLEM
jgi:hypothetical protein